MREILFRGKKVNKDKWIYGVPVKGTAYDESEMLIVESVFYCEEYFCRGCNFDPVIPETVGQFTGLTDKNGKKIFEGDIVQDGENEEYDMFFRKGVVEFGEGTFDSGIYKYTGFYYRCKNGDIDHNNIYDKEDNWSKLKVIGNIHDNPELLESE